MVLKEQEGFETIEKEVPATAQWLMIWLVSVEALV